MRGSLAITAVCLVALVAGCESRPYPPRSAESPPASAPSPGAAEPQSAAAAQPEAPPDSDVFLAARHVAKRGPTRDLRNAAFRYMNLRFSAGTLGSSSNDGTAPALASPVKVTEDAKLDALGQLLEAVRGLPEDRRAGSADCIRPYDSCASAAGDAWDAPHCSGPLLICLSEQFEAQGESG